MNLTEALAHSNNAYFEALGRRLGFEKVSYYAHQFGLGEFAGYHVRGEHLGTYPQEEISTKLGGVGKMCSFGEGISMTPLQLGALVAAIANGGTLYYLQHPTTPEAVADFQPRIKRHLDIAPAIPELSDGMAGAVALWNRPQPAPQLQRGIDPRQDRNLLARRHALRMVRLLRQHRHRTHCDGCFPARRHAYVRAEGRRNRGPHVPQSLRPQFLRRRHNSSLQPGADPQRARATAIAAIRVAGEPRESGLIMHGT